MATFSNPATATTPPTHLLFFSIFHVVCLHSVWVSKWLAGAIIIIDENDSDDGRGANLDKRIDLDPFTLLVMMIT